MTTKLCSTCKCEKPLTEFYKNKSMKDGLANWCISCAKDHRRKWRKSSPDRVAYGQVNYRYKLEDIGVTFDVWYRRSKGPCDICGKVHPQGRLHVDHCHTTGKVRGFLCSRCNTAIGLLKENVDVMKKALYYVRQWEMERLTSDDDTDAREDS